MYSPEAFVSQGIVFGAGLLQLEIFNFIPSTFINNQLQDSFNLKYNIRNDENILVYNGDNNSSEIKLKLKFKIKYKLFDIETFQNNEQPTLTSIFHDPNKYGNLKKIKDDSYFKYTSNGINTENINECINRNIDKDYVLHDGENCYGVYNNGHSMFYRKITLDKL